MRHTIPIEELKVQIPQVEEMGKAVGACVHCGFCLATCPTYLTMGEEMDSPRGRIFLMKEVLEGNLDLDEALTHIDPCLGCVACETSCPSGVHYGELISPFKAWAEDNRKGNGIRRVRRRLLLKQLASPMTSRWLARLGLWVRPFRGFFPAALRAPLDLLPGKLPRRGVLKARYPAVGERRATVILLAGCAQRTFRPEINRATISVLTRNGVEVLVPGDQGCCGSLAMHAGEADLARHLASRNLRAFSEIAEETVDAVITNAAGCGSGMAEYPLLFKGTPAEEAARRLTALTTDVSAFLADLGLLAQPEFSETVKVAYHDACHLAHAQRERSAPRSLLSSIRNLELVEPKEWEVCCGSAGIYNLEHPETATALGVRKAQNLAETGASAIAAGNIGCLMQIQNHLEIPVLHTIEILDRAYNSEPLSLRRTG